MKDFIREQLLYKSQKVLNLIEDIDSDYFCELKYNLKNSKELLETDTASNKPLIITLLGGTKAGKSHIFNEFHCAKLSETSDDIGACTKKLIISCDENQRAWVPAVSAEEIIFVDGIYSIPGIMLIDSPDIDSDNINNRKLAYESVKASDIVIFVTTPDKKFDFTIWEFLQKWADKKRWYFVLNKAENVTSEESESIKKKIGNDIINKFGFNNSASDFNNYFYALKGREKNNDENFLKLKKLIFNNKVSETTEALHDKNKLNAFAQISTERLTNFIDEKIQKIDESNKILEKKYSDRIKEFESDVFLIEETRSCFIYHFCKAMCEKNSFMMSPFFAVSQLLYTNKNEEYLNKRLSEGIWSDPRIRRLYSDEDEIIKNEGFENINNQLVAVNNSLTLADSKMNIVDKAVREANHWTWNMMLCLVNAAPVSIFALFIWHTIADWVEGKWLPTDFFVHGLVALSLTAILGYWLMWFRLSRKCKSISSIITINGDDTEFNHFIKLKCVYDRMKEIRKSIRDLSENAKIWRDAIIIPEDYGMEVKK